MEKKKTKNVSISLEQSLLKKAKEAAKKANRNFSNYLASLIQDDIDKT